MSPQRRRWFVTAKQIAVKKYVVKLSAEEREQLGEPHHVQPLEFNEVNRSSAARE